MTKLEIREWKKNILNIKSKKYDSPVVCSGYIPIWA